jgi:transcriptional regulator GlxA family with amidase domain
MGEGAGIPLNRPNAPLGRSNAVLRGRGRVHYVKEYPGPLSIKSVIEGTVVWEVGGRRLTVDPDSFLVLHEGEPYSMNLESRTPVSTLCVFFERGFVESVHASMGSQDLEPVSGPGPFFGALHRRDRRILPRMQAIAAGSADLDEQYLALAADLALLDRDLERRVRLMPGQRMSTRAELLRRVSRAQEYLHSQPDADLTLAALARQACLSTYHFHRAFTAAFGRTPHQYRTGLRLARAKRLLESTDLTVTEICGAVGFESAASFSLLFRRSFGVSPAAMRKVRKIR